jgi:hypothetical protein
MGTVVWVGVGDGVTVAVPDGTPEGVGIIVAVAVTVPGVDGDAVAVGLAVAVGAPGGVAVGTPVGAGVPGVVSAGEGVAKGAWPCVAEGTAVASWGVTGVGDGTSGDGTVAVRVAATVGLGPGVAVEVGRAFASRVARLRAAASVARASGVGRDGPQATRTAHKSRSNIPRWVVFVIAACSPSLFAPWPEHQL